MKQQTAVDWLELVYHSQQGYLSKIDFKEAKAIEKEQIIDAWNNDDSIDGEYYYQETYQHPDPSDDEIFNNFNHEGGIKYENNTQN